MVEPIFWLPIPQQDGWGLVTVYDRKVGMLYNYDVKGKTIIKVAGYHTGETKWIGEQRNILTIKLEKIPEGIRNGMILKIRNRLPQELRNVAITFIDERYLSNGGKSK